MSASRVKRNTGKINKGAVAVQTYAGPDAPQFEFPPQLKPENKRLIDALAPPPVTNGVPLYCNQRGNEDRLYKAPIEDFRSILPGKALYEGKRMSMSDLIGYTQEDHQARPSYPFQLGIKADGGRPLFPSAL